MRAPDKKPVVKLIGNDGDAFAILGRCKRALRAAGADDEYVTKYLQESSAGDYDNLLQVAMKYCEVE
uniref:Uncharacterized protein n=1 Tax=viral metagenome TaxID=1070528 RepID=A0A6H1ZZV7_9ZZZZ